MKILQLCPYLYPALTYGGPAKMLYDLSLELSKKNTLTIYTSDVWDAKRRIRKSEKLVARQNLTVNYFPNFNNYLAYKIRFFTNFGIIFAFLKNHHKFDLLHFHDVLIIPQILLAYLAIIFNKKYIITPHGVLDPVRSKKKTLLKKMVYALAKPILKKAEFVVAVSDQERKDLIKLGFKKEQVKLIFNGVPELSLKASQKFKKFKNDKLITLLYIGKIHPQKGLEELIKAFVEVDANKFQLLIAGPDDGFKKNLQKIIKNKNLKNIHFLGFVNSNNKKELYEMADLFVYPSYAEGFSISILEAMQAKLAVLISKNCNFPEVKKCKAGIIVDNDDLLNNLKKALKNIQADKNQLKKYGQNGKELIAGRYSAQKMTEQYLKIYEKLL